MADEVLTRVRRLVELAAGSDANPNEARNAALKAARMIKLHGLAIVRVAARAEEAAREAVREAACREEAGRRAERSGSEPSGDVVRAVGDAVADVASAAAREAVGALFSGRRRR